MSTLHLQSEPMVLRIAQAIARYVGFGDEIEVVQPREISSNRTSSPTLEQRPRLSVVHSLKTPEQPLGHKWRRHPQLRNFESSIDADVRTSRYEAVRGICAARAGALDVAVERFAHAARCEDVDLTAVPGFWNLTRGQMEAAVDAYQQSGRYRDAAALDAHIATIFRPSLVGAEVSPVLPSKPQRTASR